MWAKAFLCTKLGKYIYPIGNIHWERMEREYTTDELIEGVPTLEDLGVNLTRLEHQVPWELKPFTDGLYYTMNRDDPLPPVRPPNVIKPRVTY